MADWTFLTDHAHTLVCLARDPYATTTALARRIGISEPRVEAIVTDLIEAGYLVEQRDRHGHTVRRVVNRRLPLRHPVERHHPVGRLLDAVQTPAELLRERLHGGD